MSLYLKPHSVGRMVFSASDALRLIEAAARRHGKRGQRPQVALDLDGTLIDNNARTITILQEYTRSMDGWFVNIPDLDASDLDYGPESAFDALRRKGVQVPDWVAPRFREFWAKRFFTAEYQDHDLTEEGAAEFVRALTNDLGLDVVYLTGRDREKMLLGVVKNLHERGFPVATPRTRMVFKPAFAMKDLEFKEGALADLQRSNPVIGFVDNEPPICNMARGIVPSVPAVFWFDRPHAPNPPKLVSSVRVMQSFKIN